MNNNIATSKKKANIVGMVFGIIATLVFAGLLIWECVQFVSNLSSNFEWMIESIKYLEYGHGIDSFVNLITYNVLIPVSYAIFLLLLTAYSLATVIMKGYGNKILYFITFIAGIVYSCIAALSLVLDFLIYFLGNHSYHGALIIFIGYILSFLAIAALLIGILIAGLAGVFRKKVLYIILGIAGAISFLVSRLLEVAAFSCVLLTFYEVISFLKSGYLADYFIRMILEYYSPRIFEITSLTIASTAIVVVVLFLHPKSKERK